VIGPPTHCGPDPTSTRTKRVAPMLDEGSGTEQGRHRVIAASRANDGDALIYAIGYGSGYDVGWAHGWVARDDEFQAMLGVYRPILARPRQADLEKARQLTDEPCRLRCGRCSRCARASAVAGNVRRYGQPDYPGAVK
jgi:hypothetical protein